MIVQEFVRSNLTAKIAIGRADCADDFVSNGNVSERHETGTSTGAVFGFLAQRVLRRRRDFSQEKFQSTRVNSNFTAHLSNRVDGFSLICGARTTPPVRDSSDWSTLKIGLKGSALSVHRG